MDELTQAPRVSQATRSSPLALVFWLAEGPRVERLADDPVVIGRGAPADLVVPEATLSREHARLQPFPGGVRIDDLDSKNGLHFRGRRVTSVELFPGDTCELGDLRVSLTSLSRTVAADRAVRSVDPLDRLDLELVAARTFGRPLAIALVDPDAGTRAALATSLRAVDAVGAYAGARLLVVVAQGDVATATRLVEGALGDRGRAGIATCPAIEADAHLLLAAADAALAVAEPGHVAVAAPRAAPPHALIVAGPRMRAVIAELERWAPSALPVLVRGETGTGKALVAREVHRVSGRGGPFHTVHGGALPADWDGRFAEEAAGGTVFLDELDELSLAAQGALLRALDRGQHRIVAATRRDLDALVKAGTFRDDLLYRLDPLSVTLPPLRERPDDLLALADHFLRAACAAAGKEVLAIDGAVSQVLLDHTWPGNVRELRNTVERAVLVAAGRSLGVADLPERLRATAELRDDERGPVPELATVAGGEPIDAETDGAVDENETGTGALRDRLREVEIRLIVRALEQAKGNQGLAAQLLGLPKRTLVYKLARFGLRRVGRYEPID